MCCCDFSWCIYALLIKVRILLKKLAVPSLLWVHRGFNDIFRNIILSMMQGSATNCCLLWSMTSSSLPPPRSMPVPKPTLKHLPCQSFYAHQLWSIRSRKWLLAFLISGIKSAKIFCAGRERAYNTGLMLALPFEYQCPFLTTSNGKSFPHPSASYFKCHCCISLPSLPISLVNSDSLMGESRSWKACIVGKIWQCMRFIGRTQWVVGSHNHYERMHWIFIGFWSERPSKVTDCCLSWP